MLDAEQGKKDNDEFMATYCSYFEVRTGWNYTAEHTNVMSVCLSVLSVCLRRPPCLASLWSQCWWS